MRVIASVQAKRSSSRGLVHYIAHSKTDPNKEPNVRELFNEYSDQTNVKKSNEFLKNGTSRRRPSNDELHHLVISLKVEDYDKLGTSEKEKQNSLKQITRHALCKLKDKIGAERLAWAAGIHRNTNNPHVHIAINKTYFDKNMDKKQLKKIPRSLLPHYEKENGERNFNPGILITEATKKMDEILLEKKQNKSTQRSKKQAEKNPAEETLQNAKIQEERDILAQAILAKFYLEKSKENLKSLENHGDKRRFKITDKITNRRRKMSLFDLERLATREAASQIKKLGITDPIKKDELKKTLVESEMQKNADGIKRIKTILRELVARENQTLRRHEKTYNKTKPLAKNIRQKYRKENTKLPVPNLNSEDLEMMQTASLDKKDIRVLNYFERVRTELARERSIPTRTKEQISRLKAKQIISNLKVVSLEKQSKDFEQRKRNFSFEIGGETWSLAKVDTFTQKQQDDDQKITKKISKVLKRSGLVSNKEKQPNLSEIKTQILEKLDGKGEQIIHDLKSEKLILKTLDKFCNDDTNPEKEKIPAEFTPAELEMIEAFAFELKDKELYQETWTRQKQFIEQATSKDETQKESFEKLKQKTIAGRILAREVISGIELARSKEELEIFEKHKRFQKYEVTDKKTGESKFISLRQVEFDFRGSVLDQTIAYFIENREIRRTRHKIEKSIKENHSELIDNLKSARDFYRNSKKETQDYKTKSFFRKANYTHPPLFTPKELLTIELRIKLTEKKSETKKLQNILDSADHSEAKNLSAILNIFASEKEVFKDVEQKNDERNQQTDKTQNLKEKTHFENQGNLEINQQNHTLERGR